MAHCQNLRPSPPSQVGGSHSSQAARAWRVHRGQESLGAHCAVSENVGDCRPAGTALILRCMYSAQYAVGLRMDGKPTLQNGRGNSVEKESSQPEAAMLD